MPALSLLPAEPAAARLVTSLSGAQWLEFDATLAPGTQMALPGAGTVTIRRGHERDASGERVPDALRSIAPCTDDETGQAVPPRFGVALFLDEAAFDRMVARTQWSLPRIDLDVEAGSATARSWWAISSAMLTQRPRSEAA